MASHPYPDNPATEWRYGLASLAALAGALALALLALRGGLGPMVGSWYTSEEYSHGFLIPLVAGWLIWQRADAWRRLDFEGAWSGVAVVAAGFAAGLFGELAGLYVLIQYGALLVIWGGALACLGWRAFRIVAVPLFMLFFVVPLPAFLYNNLSQQLQLVSSELGVWFIRLFGISVYLEGNVIDLGSMKLQVVEACNGLRYLFPLTALAFIAAYLFRAPWWQRAIVFVSAAPLTVVMNSFRIGVIGYLVDHHGRSMAEGFLHDFEGWVVFMACFGLLVGEMWLLNRLGGGPPFREVFGLEPPAPATRAVRRQRRVPAPAWAAAALCVPAALASALLPQRTETVPARADFSTFPLELEDWAGRRDQLAPEYVQALKFDDYLLADYRQDDAAVNLYAAWYDSQRKGRSAHSPRSCMPGGGWVIEELDTRFVDGIPGGGLPVNRALISMGEHRQLVYYWFRQRGRLVTNEYLVKWYMFVDALLRNRTDGALLRLVTPLAPGEDPAAGDARLRAFAALAVPRLAAHVPD